MDPPWDSGGRKHHKPALGLAWDFLTLMSSTGGNNRRPNPAKSAPEAKTCQLTTIKGKTTWKVEAKPQNLKDAKIGLI